MNPNVLEDFNAALKLVNGDPSAAASLALASALRDSQTLMPASTSEVLTVSDAAAHLKISPKTLYTLCRRGKVRNFRIGNHVRIPAEELVRIEGDYIVEDPIPELPTITKRYF